jgi:hypothetical protein
MRKWLVFLLCLLANQGLAQTTPFEKGNGNQTTSYDECISWYRQLAALSPWVELDSIGLTDIGRPLHAVVIGLRQPQPSQQRPDNRAVVFINNGIHPGEPEGIDASMRLARELSQGSLRRVLERLIVVIIPIYNVDGSLQRNGFSRANQNGPEQYGFRGNARNLDLNRDFTKLDSRNARSLVSYFSRWDPDLYLETHTTNGADYQHVMTLIETQKDKLRPEISSFMQQHLTPALYEGMEQAGLPMCPYVNSRGELPESGLVGFLETPRYGSGYAATWHCPAYVLETHMLKPYALRYEATYALLQLSIETAARQSTALLQARQTAKQAASQATAMALNWELNEAEVDSFYFRGYTAQTRPSEVHGQSRLFYNRNLPWEAKIAFHNSYTGIDSVRKPLAYLIPQAWNEVIDRLLLQSIPLRMLPNDTQVLVEMYRITDYKTVGRPYEGRYLHYQTQYDTLTRLKTYHQGDVVVQLGQATDRLVMELLEPWAVDSYFNWGFFDGILMQKEYFSSYVFEDTAAELLQNSYALREALAQWKVSLDKEPGPRQQLDFIYRAAFLVEPDLQLYPVGRLLR